MAEAWQLLAEPSAPWSTLVDMAITALAFAWVMQPRELRARAPLASRIVADGGVAIGMLGIAWLVVALISGGA